MIRSPASRPDDSGRSPSLRGLSVGAATIIDRCGADPTIVHVIRPGVDCHLFHPLGAPHLSDDDRPWPPRSTASDESAQVGPAVMGENPNGYLLFAGRLQPLKAPDLALAALALIPADVRPTLVIAGETSQDFAGYRQDLIRDARRRRLQGDQSEGLGVGGHEQRPRSAQHTWESNARRLEQVYAGLTATAHRAATPRTRHGFKRRP